MTTSGPAPEDLETIAAFIDQRLTRDEREAFMKRLDSEEALYEVFVETVRWRDESSRDEMAEVVEHPASWRKWALPAAMAAGLAAAVGLVVLVVGPAEDSYAQALVADGGLEGRLDEEWLTPLWSEMRGISPVTDEADAAFRIGVRTVDLEVALRTGRKSDAVGLTRRLDRLLQTVELSEPVRAVYADLRRKIEEDRVSSHELIGLARSASTRVEGYLPELEPALELGRWAEAGRLAARSGNQRLLRSRSFRGALSELRAAEWTPEVGAGLDALGELLAAGEGNLDLAAIEEAFASIIAQS